MGVGNLPRTGGIHLWRYLTKDLLRCEVFSHAAEVFDLLDYAESCEVFPRRLSQPSVYSSREPVRRSLFRLLEHCVHIAATFEPPAT
jgi:hypothetical protein